jgi:tRNA-dihydrouridine synthase B
MVNFWKELNRPIKVLAPMAGYTDSAFRTLCRSFGADVVITELVSADAIFYHAKNWFKDEAGIWQSKKGKDETLEMLKFVEKERPIAIQLFGKFPEKFAFASDWITKNLKPDGIDINMGCPARKVVGSDHGAALIKYPALAAEIVTAVKDNTDLPVSVKTRLGWDNQDQILEFAPVLVNAGIDALIVHGRTYKQGFSGEADWDNIYEAKKMFPNLTVIGNGGIKSFSDVQYSKFGVQIDGCAIGQATFGKPWIFYKDTIESDELKRIITLHAKLAFETKGELGIIEFRKHLLSYLKGFPGAKELRKEAVSIVNLRDVSRVVGQL